MYQFSSVQSLSCVQLFVTPWIAALQAGLSITNPRSSLKLTSIESVMPSSHLILCRPLLFLPPIPPSIKVFPNESTLCMHRDIIQIASSGTQFKSISVEEALSSVQQNFCSSLGVQLPFLKVTWKNVKWRINEFVNYNPKVESPIKYIL